MKMAIIIVLVILGLLTALFGYFGGFSKIIIRTLKAGGEVLVYENVTGAYNQASKVSNKIYYDLLNTEKIPTTKGFGIYYDNPKNVEQSKLRSEVGCIVDAVDNNLMDKLKEKYQVKTVPEENCLVVEFPFKGGFSILVGMIKVYPVIEKYVTENNYLDGPVMEIYDVPNKKIIYRKFLNKN
ncbi:hypothetical protein EZS27_014806 [termite gut metagenome]|uniref:GyrI-like small molecule binding domain-containing protein n=1 Tax=termite gut metagenome TaxID=433724 RepID=A0A5J4RTL1_9ZZZZ